MRSRVTRCLLRVEELLPGVTTVTPHARYYSLHAYVATALSAHGELDPVDTLRRCEVVFGAISILNSRRFPDQHLGCRRLTAMTRAVCPF